MKLQEWPFGAGNEGWNGAVFGIVVTLVPFAAVLMIACMVKYLST